MQLHLKLTGLVSLPRSQISFQLTVSGGRVRAAPGSFSWKHFLSEEFMLEVFLSSDNIYKVFEYLSLALFRTPFICPVSECVAVSSLRGH